MERMDDVVGGDEQNIDSARMKDWEVGRCRGRLCQNGEDGGCRGRG